MTKLRIVFAGTPDFACPSLQALIDSPHEVTAVLTQPDRAAGRGRNVHMSPIKQLANTHHLPVLQPNTLREVDVKHSLATICDGNPPDLMVVAAYGLLLPQSVLDIPRLGCVNVHASLLPRWRGASPIQHAILSGDKQCGVTIMQMEKGLDSGPMIHTIDCEITTTDNASTLHDKLAQLGATALIDALEILQSPNFKLTEQPHEGITYAHKIAKQDAHIDWTQNAMDIERAIRAYYGWPVCHSSLGDKLIRIWQASVQPDNAPQGSPGEILAFIPDGLDIQTGQGILRITECQLPGKKISSTHELYNAYQNVFVTGAILT